MIHIDDTFLLQWEAIPWRFCDDERSPNKMDTIGLHLLIDISFEMDWIEFPWSLWSPENLVIDTNGRFRHDDIWWSLMIYDIQSKSKQHMEIRGKSWEIRAHHDVLRCPSRPSGAHLLVAAAASRGQGETLRGRVELHDQFGPDQEFQHVSIRFNTFKIQHFSTTILGWLGTRKETKRQRLGFSSWQWKLATWCWEAFLISYFMDDSVERVGLQGKGFNHGTERSQDEKRKLLTVGCCSLRSAGGTWESGRTGKTGYPKAPMISTISYFRLLVLPPTEDLGKLWKAELERQRSLLKLKQLWILA